MTKSVFRTFRAAALSLILVTLVGLGGVALAAEKKQGLESFLNVPLASDLTTSEGGGKIAWLQTMRGARNIWIAEAPAYVGKAITSNSADDGQEISAIALSRDGRFIIYVRGGAPNRNGERPNPLHDPDGVEQAIWRISTEGGKAERLADGSSPAISPDGKQLAFIRQGQLHLMDLGQGASSPRRVQSNGIAGSPVWAPDGSKISFASERQTHGFIGIFSLSSNSIRYLDPSVDRDSGVVWSPDSTQVAFVRSPSPIARAYGEAPPAPWSIRVAKAADGVGHEVWKANSGVGSVLDQTNPAKRILWGGDNRIVFPWEGSGWVHYYSVPVSGGKPTALSAGQFEVGHATLSPDGKRLLFSSNQGVPELWHLWQVPLSGGTPSQVTKGDGTEVFPFFADNNGQITFIRTDRVRPPYAVIRMKNGSERELDPQGIPAEYPKDLIVAPESVVITASDGMKIPAQIFRSSRLVKGQRHPAIVFVHGGPRQQMLLGWHWMYQYRRIYAMNQALADQGFIVLSINFRGTPGYGVEFRKGTQPGHLGGSELNDIVGAGQYLKGRPDVDPQRIGIWGASYGGYLTGLALAKESGLFKAGVDWCGISDFNLMAPYAAATADIAKQNLAASPMAYVDSWRSPVLFIHGDDDRNVSINNTVQLVAALRHRNVEFEQLIIPDEAHSFLTDSAAVKGMEAATRFLNKHLNSPAR